jgi:hypothetical protein
MDCVKDLPVEVLSKIVSYKSEYPEYLKIKYCHIEALKRIQNKYRITKTQPKITTYRLRKGNKPKKSLDSNV